MIQEDEEKRKLDGMSLLSGFEMTLLFGWTVRGTNNDITICGLTLDSEALFLRLDEEDLAMDPNKTRKLYLTDQRNRDRLGENAFKPLIHYSI